MLAKLIVRGADRNDAIRRMQAALAETRVMGVATNLPLLRAIADAPPFAAADLDTHFLERLPRAPGETAPDPWHALHGWRLNAPAVHDMWIRPDAGPARVAVASPGSLASATPGIVKAVLVKPGARVTRGTPLLVIESMKLEVPLNAPDDGIVEKVLVGVGDQVEEGRTLIAFKDAA
jgi:acetyl/propionyl-CoA carboxylase alpha subunit